MGTDLNFPRYTNPKGNLWWGEEELFVALDWFFGVTFTVEVVLKMIGLRRRKFIRDKWNCFDLAIQMLWLFDAFSRDIVTMPIDAMLLRMGRLARLMRLVRLAKTLRGLDPLFLMVTTLQGSITALVWASIFLFVCQTFCAFVLYQIVTSYYLEQNVASNDRKIEAFRYFGTFTRALLSMFEITLGNWMPVARLLFDDVSEWFFFFSVLHKLSMGFAVIGVINGIFIQETFKVASCDDTIMFLQKERAMKTHVRKMRKFFDKADQSHDDVINRAEWHDILSNPAVCTWLSAQELDSFDVDDLFALLSKGKDEINVLDLIQGVSRLKGNARSVDLAVLAHHHAQLLSQHEMMQSQVQAILDVVCSRQISDYNLPVGCVPNDALDKSSMYIASPEQEKGLGKDVVLPNSVVVGAGAQ